MYVAHELTIQAETDYRRNQLMSLRRPRRPRRAHRPRRTMRPRMARAVAGTGEATCVA
ncbi:MAG TPA: hypothetical protein VFZ64_00885 [Nocardioidaceae bacterium]